VRGIKKKFHPHLNPLPSKGVERRVDLPTKGRGGNKVSSLPWRERVRVRGKINRAGSLYFASRSS